MKLETGNNNCLDSRHNNALSDPYPKRRSDLSTRAAEGEMLILDRQGGVIHQLNVTASMIWELCDGQTNVDEIVAQIAEAFEVDASTARNDVSRTIDNFASLNLLEQRCV